MLTHKIITQSSGHSIDNVISMLLLAHATHNIIPVIGLIIMDYPPLES